MFTKNRIPKGAAAFAAPLYCVKKLFQYYQNNPGSIFLSIVEIFFDYLKLDRLPTGVFHQDSSNLSCSPAEKSTIILLEHV